MDNSNQSGNLPLSGAGTILVMDDEELMREVTKIMIEDNGAAVVTGVDGHDGVEVFLRNRDNINIVVTDFSMPRMNGYQAYCEIKKIKPTVAFVVISGLKITSDVEVLRKRGDVEFLGKPFQEAELIACLKRACERLKG